VLDPNCAGTTSVDEGYIGARDGAEDVGKGWVEPGNEIGAAIAT